MPDYVTRGTVQFLTHDIKNGGHIQINPINDYLTTHKGTRYVIFFDDDDDDDDKKPGPPKGFTVVTEFKVPSELTPILIQAAFARTSLEISIGEGTAEDIRKITIPAMS